MGTVSWASLGGRKCRAPLHLLHSHTCGTLSLDGGSPWGRGGHRHGCGSLRPFLASAVAAPPGCRSICSPVLAAHWEGANGSQDAAVPLRVQLRVVHLQCDWAADLVLLARQAEGKWSLSMSRLYLGATEEALCRVRCVTHTKGRPRVLRISRAERTVYGLLLPVTSEIPGLAPHQTTLPTRFHLNPSP